MPLTDSLPRQECSYLDSVQDVEIFNSEGLKAADRRVRTRFITEAVAGDGREKQSGRMSPGGSEGFELFERIDIRELSRQAAGNGRKPCSRPLHARRGKMTVVIDNGFGGVIFHEACGHALEATSVAKGASVFAGKLGEKNSLGRCDGHRRRNDQKRMGQP